MQRFRSRSWIELLLQANIVDIVIFDRYGFKSGDDSQECVTSLSRDHNKKVVIVSSSEGILTASDSGLSRKNSEATRWGPAYLKTTEKLACIPSFFKYMRDDFQCTEDTCVEDRLQEKYFYAGASATLREVVV